MIRRSVSNCFIPIISSHLNHPVILVSVSILSMVTTDTNADIPFPTMEDWARATSQSDNKFFSPDKNFSSSKDS